MSLDYQPTIWWDERELNDAAEFLEVANPAGNADVENKIQYIKNHSTTVLMEKEHPTDISTGGWQVCFFLNTNDSGIPIDFEYYAKVSITPYTANYYLKQQESYKDKLTGLDVKNGKFVYPVNEDEDPPIASFDSDVLFEDVGLTD